VAARGALEPATARHHLSVAAPGQRNAVELLLGHRFRNPALLDEALTHRSALYERQARRREEKRGAGSNERLEFVGDRVLGLLVAEWLIERFPDEQEGDLGQRLALLVSRVTLAVIAEAAGLSQALSIAKGDARAGVGGQATVLADAIEAVLGAVYLDGGLDPARDFVRRAWAGAMDAHPRPPKDPKTVLQEWLMARGKALPVYVLAGQDGPSHAPSFRVEVSAHGLTGTGSGSNKRLAERMAALDLQAKLGAAP